MLNFGGIKMKINNKILLKWNQCLVVLAIIGLPSILLAHGDEQHKNVMNKNGNYIKKLSLNGTELTFHVTTHDISLTITDKKNNQKIKNAIVKLKVVAPDKKVIIQKLEKKKDYYNSSFSLDQKGIYKVLVLIKIEDKKKKAGFQFKID